MRRTGVTGGSAFAGFVLVLLLIRLAAPERSLTQVGHWALWDAAFAVMLAAIIGILAASAGVWFLDRIGVSHGIGRIETAIFVFGTGSGLLALAVLALALAGWLHAYSLFALLVAGAVCFRRQVGRTLTSLASILAGGDLWRNRSAVERLGLILAAGIFGLASIQALAPAWDYDGLMYHLQAPRLFLQAGRLVPLPQIWQANGPLNVEMLYTIGLAFGSDSAARLIHLGSVLALVLTTLAMGRRFLTPGGGWMAAAALLGTPILPIWGSLAFADGGWALYEVLAIFALLLWRENREPRRLLLSGGMAGLALGSKYLALGLLLPLLATTILVSWRYGPRAALRNSSILLIAAAALAWPWYLKNLVWFGNPVYPFFLGGPDWPAERLRMLTAFLGSFGTGKSFADFMALPWNLYVRHEAFGTFMTTIEVPGLLLPVAVLTPLVRMPAAVRTVGLVALLRFATWAVGSQQIRFLLPVLPLLAVLATAVLIALASRLGLRLASVLGAGLGVGLLAATLAYQLIFLGNTRPTAVVLGFEAKDQFLERAVYDYPALRYIRQELPSEARIYMAWDGQGYYCDDRCLPDAEQSQFVQLLAQSGSMSQAVGALRAQGYSHLLVDLEGMNFLLRHDPTGLHASASQILVGGSGSSCLEPAVAAHKVVLWRMSCP